MSNERQSVFSRDNDYTNYANAQTDSEKMIREIKENLAECVESMHAFERNRDQVTTASSGDISDLRTLLADVMNLQLNLLDLATFGLQNN